MQIFFEMSSQPRNAGLRRQLGSSHYKQDFKSTKQVLLIQSQFLKVHLFLNNEILFYIQENLKKRQRQQQIRVKYKYGTKYARSSYVF